MKLIFSKIWELIFGYDHRRWFPEKWDLSEVHVWEEYGGNNGFINYYKTKSYYKFTNGIDIKFYPNSFKIMSINGYTTSGFCSIAFNKKALLSNFKQNEN